MSRALAKTPLYPPGVQSAVDYADDVIAGRVDAGHLVHLSCERFRRDIDERIWEFRDDLAERAMDFAGQMPNIKGPEAGHLLRLMPWQRLVFANLFGFVEPGTNTRRFRQGVVFVPRGNGKTTFAAPLALYMTFMDGEGGAPRRAILLRLPAAFGLGATRFCLGRLRFSNPFSEAV
jgi:phage terminase large subunit-like protein